MATVQETIRRLTIEAKSPGVQQAANDLQELSRAQAEVTVTAQSQEKATLSVERALDRVQRQYDQAWRAEQQLARVERDLTAARSQGLITLERQNQLLDLARARLNGVNPALATGAAGFSRFGGAIQQAGYQVGDFAVQVASGTSPLRAFIQQGTQMLGVFGPMGAVLGALVAVGGVLATTFLDLGDSAEDAADGQDKLNQSLREMSELMDKIDAKGARTRASLEAERRNRVSLAELELRRAEERLQSLGPEYQTAIDPFGGESVTRTPGYQEAQAEVARLRQELLLLRAAAGEFGQGTDRMGLRLGTPATGAAGGAAGGAAATQAGVRTTRELKLATDDLGNSLNGLLNRLDPTRAAFQQIARDQALLDLALERGKVTTAEYEAAMAALDAEFDKLSAPKAARALEETSRAAEDATVASAALGDSLHQVGQTGFRSLLGLASGALTARDALAQVVDALAQVFASRAESGFGDLLSRGLDLLPSLFGGYGGPGLQGSGTGAVGPFAGFAEGGSFRVGGSGGRDSQLVAFRASPDETVTITRPDQAMGGPAVNVGGIHVRIVAGTPEQNEDAAAKAMAAARREMERFVVGVMARQADRGNLADRGRDAMRV